MKKWPWRQSDWNLCWAGKGLETPTADTNSVLSPREQLSVRKCSVLANDLMGLLGTAPLGISASFHGHWVFWQRRPSEREAFHLQLTKLDIKACFLEFISLARAASAQSRLTMNLAPGKFDLRLKWIFIQKRRCYLEIITKDSSYVFNKWLRWNGWAEWGYLVQQACFPLGLSQLHLPGLSLFSFTSFSLEIKVSSCHCTSFRILAPLANYSICLWQNYFSQVPAYSWGPNITTYACSPCCGMTTYTSLKMTFLCCKEVPPRFPLTQLPNSESSNRAWGFTDMGPEVDPALKPT